MILWQLFLAFFRLGAMTWGGGYVMLPIMQAECTTRRGWLTEPEFFDYLAIAQSSPGPVATNTALLIGRHVAGVQGSVVCVLGVTLPSFLVMMMIGAVLLGRGMPPWVQSMLYVLKPVAIGLILAAAIRLAGNLPRKKGPWLALAASVLLLALGLHPLFVLVLGGVMSAVIPVERGQG